MNHAIFAAAKRAGCTASEAEVIATYVEVEKLDTVATRLGMSERAVLRALSRARRRVGVSHNSALVAYLWQFPEPSLRRTDS